MTNREFYFDLTTGSIPQLADFHKFGRNLTIGTTQEAVTTAGVYRTPQTLTTLEIVSSSDNDGAGTDAGATKVTVQGIGPNWEEIIEEVSLNGLTPVVLTNQFYRVYRMNVTETNIYATETQGSHLGNITLREESVGQTWADIDNVAIFPRGQSQISCYTVPKGIKAYIRNVYIYVDANKESNVVMFQRSNANETEAPYSGSLNVHIEYDGVIGQGEYVSPIPLGPFSEYTDILFMGTTSVGTAAVAVHFDMILVEETDQ